jgi:hypothetical protein
MQEEARSVTLEEVTQAAVSGVLRAMEARHPERDFSEELPDLPWSILIGLILNPGKPFLSTLPEVKTPGGDG